MFAALLLAASLPAAPVPKETRTERDAVLKILAARAWEPELRREAVELMGLLRYKKAAQEIRKYLNDRSQDVRIEAVASLIRCGAADEDCANLLRSIVNPRLTLQQKDEAVNRLNPVFLAIIVEPLNVDNVREFLSELYWDKQVLADKSLLNSAYFSQSALSTDDSLKLSTAIAALDPKNITARDLRNFQGFFHAIAATDLPTNVQKVLERSLEITANRLDIDCARCLLKFDINHEAALRCVKKYALLKEYEFELSYRLCNCITLVRGHPAILRILAKAAFSGKVKSDFKMDYWSELAGCGSAAKEFAPDFEALTRSAIDDEKFPAMTALIRIDPKFYEKYIPAIMSGIGASDESEFFFAIQAVMAIGRPDDKLVARLVAELKPRSIERHSMKQLAMAIGKLDPNNAELAKWFRNRLKAWPEESTNPDIGHWHRTPELLHELGPAARQFAPDLLKLVPDEAGVLPHRQLVQAIGSVSQPKK